MTVFQGNQLRLHNGTDKFRIGTINNKKDALFQEFILQISGCLFEGQQALFTCNIG